MKSSAPKPVSDVRSRLVDVAGEVFGDRGFSGATVREICTRAGTNVAAVNYYFGDKRGLYLEVLRRAAACFERDDGAPCAEESAGPAHERLAHWIEGFLFSLLDASRPAWHARVMAQEMIDPSPALDEFVSTTIRPRQERMVALVREIEPRLDDAGARMCAESIVAQVLHHRHARAVVGRLCRGLTDSPAQIKALGAHITAFSLGGLAAAASGRTGAP